MDSVTRQATATRHLRVVSYNIHACVGRDGRFAPARILRVLEELNADIIGLQEVEDRRVHGRTVSELLADGLGMHATRGPTLQRSADAYGNLLLTREVPAAVQQHDLSVDRHEPRGAIEATLSVAGGSLQVLVTHFGLSGNERRRQLEMLMPAVPVDDAHPRLLLADFNEWRPGNRLHRELKRRYESCPPLRTFPARAPLLALDRIYVAPHGHIQRVHVERGGPARIASDHLPLVADLRFPRSSSA